MLNDNICLSLCVTSQMILSTDNVELEFVTDIHAIEVVHFITLAVVIHWLQTI